MAIPFLNLRCQQRSKGQSALAKAAYNSCSRLDESDYSKKTGLVFSALMLAPGQYQKSRSGFWREIEAKEKRCDATVSREIVAALPLELDQAQRQQLATTFALQIRQKFNLPGIDLNIHEPKIRKRGATAQENPHLHLQFPDRNASGKKIRQLSKSNTVKEIRKLWEDYCNEALINAGIEIRINMQTIETQIEKTKKNYIILILI